MKALTLLSLVFFLNPVVSRIHAQDRVILYDFRIINGTSDGIDVTEWLLDSEMHTVFYLDASDSTLMLSNKSYKTGTESFGRAKANRPLETVESEEGYEILTMYFDWFFENNYDDESGIAKVKAIITYKPDVTELMIHILPSDFRMIIYHGILERITEPEDL